MEYNKELLKRFLMGSHLIAVRTQEEYNQLMEFLEKETFCTWNLNAKPTDNNNWGLFKYKTTIYCRSNDRLSFGNGSNYPKGRIFEFKDLIKESNIKNECLKCNQKQREIDKMQTEINDLHLMLANRDKEISRLNESNNQLRKNNKKLKKDKDLEFEKRKLHGMYGNKKEKTNPSKNFYDSIHEEIENNKKSLNIHNSHYPEGIDTIDRAKELAKTTTLDHFEFTMQYNIDKYNLRMGKKDDKLKELDKIIDYAQIWKEYLQNK